MCSEWVREENEDKERAYKNDQKFISHIAMPCWHLNPATHELLKELGEKFWSMVPVFSWRFGESHLWGWDTGISISNKRPRWLRCKCSVGQCWAVGLNLGCTLKSLESFKNPDVNFLGKLSWVRVWAFWCASTWKLLVLWEPGLNA